MLYHGQHQSHCAETGSGSVEWDNSPNRKRCDGVRWIRIGPENAVGVYADVCVGDEVHSAAEDGDTSKRCRTQHQGARSSSGAK